MNHALSLALFLAMIASAIPTHGDPVDAKEATPAKKAGITAGEEIEVSIGDIKSHRGIQAMHEGVAYTVTLSGIIPTTSDQALNDALKTLLAGKDRRFILRVDHIDGLSIRGQLYTYAHMERDAARQKEIIDAVKKQEPCMGLRWGGMNLNLLLIQSKLAKFDIATAADSEPLFQKLADEASRLIRTWTPRAARGNGSSGQARRRSARNR